MTTETGRVEAFSDGVFAIAMTLLILEIKIPRGADHTLAHDLAMQWPSYLAFLVSFLFIGVMWVNHHRLFTHIRRANDGLLMYNLLLMLGVTVVPWPTAVLASHLRGADAKTAAYLFNGVFLAIAVFFNLFWRYAVRHNLIDEAYRHSAPEISRQYAVGPLMYVLCVATAWWNPLVSLLLNAVLAVFFALSPRVVHGDKHASSSRVVERG